MLETMDLKHFKNSSYVRIFASLLIIIHDANKIALFHFARVLILYDERMQTFVLFFFLCNAFIFPSDSPNFDL